MRKKEGFTLIELLVVIAIIALLMAILVPILRGVRRQAKAVACQSNLRQWGFVWTMYTEDSGDRFPVEDADSDVWAARLRPYYSSDYDLLFCPTATKAGRSRPPGPERAPGSVAQFAGDKFSAWYTGWPPYFFRGSYGLNEWVLDVARGDQDDFFWRTCNVKRLAEVPVLLDSRWPKGMPYDADCPVEYEDGPIAEFIHVFCTDRHDGGINSLFADWSVRKVGLKELWTLKWHRQYDTAGSWTRAGGVQPEDWPKWMRRFKDY